MKNWLINNLWIKIVSLLLAVVTWFYVNGELDKERRISAEFYKTSLMEQVENMQQKGKNQSQKQDKMNRGYIIKK